MPTSSLPTPSGLPASVATGIPARSGVCRPSPRPTRRRTVPRSLAATFASPDRGEFAKHIEKSVKAIKEYLAENYDLQIKDDWEIKKIGKHEIVDGKWKLKAGTYMCDIGGYKFSKDSTTLRDNIFLETARLARKMNKQGYYTLHQCESINARIGWASHTDNIHFLKKYITSQIDIKKTRRMISCGNTAGTGKK